MQPSAFRGKANAHADGSAVTPYRRTAWLENRNDFETDRTRRTIRDLFHTPDDAGVRGRPQFDGRESVEAMRRRVGRVLLSLQRSESCSER